MTYRARIIAAVKSTGLSLRQLEEATGVPHSCLHRYMQGRYDLNGEKIQKLCRFLKLDLPWQ